MLMSPNTGTRAMLVSPTNPSGIELYTYVNVFFFVCLFWLKNILIDHVSESTLFIQFDESSKEEIGEMLRQSC